MPGAETPKRHRRTPRASRTHLEAREIQRRLEVIELVTVSSVRALQMDLDGDGGVASSIVLKRARAAIR